MMWIDFKLSWSPVDYGGIEFIGASANDIWTPVIGLRNSVGAVVDPDWHDEFPAYIGYNGTVYWFPIGSFASTCDLDMFKFRNMCHQMKSVGWFKKTLFRDRKLAFSN